MRLISYGTTVIVRYSFKWQCMAGAGAVARAEIMDKGCRKAEKEPEPKINNFGSATLFQRVDPPA